MSIVICVVNQNREFYLASDLRAIRNGIAADNYQKVYEIRGKVYFGMTGIAEEGHNILADLKANSNKTVLELIEYADSIFQPSPKMLTIMLSGEDENGNYFIWQKNHHGQITNAEINDSSVAFSISANHNITAFNNQLRLLISSGVSIEKAMELTIDFASKMDNTISPTFKLIKHT
jgi:20S proteasome alpha/beta subunit